MARFIVFLAALVSVQANSVNRAGGWSPPPPPTTPGWSAPPTEPPTEASTTTPGWSPPPPPPSNPGWGPPPSANNVSINLNGGLAAVAGSGGVSEAHGENIQVTGGDGVQADLSASAGGDSIAAQEGNIYQITDIEGGESAFSLNAVSVGQVAVAEEGLGVIASGADILVGQGGVAAASGEGASAVAADTTILVN